MTETTTAERTGTAVAVPQAPASKPPLRAGGGLTMIVPQDVEQAWRMADMIDRSRLAPDTLNSPQKIVVAIFHGLECGLPPMQAVQSIAVVGNRPTIWGDMALAMCWASGLLADHDEGVRGEGDKMVGWCSVSRPGRTKPVERTFSVEDAKRAKLWGNPKKVPWIEYPQRMLMLRARSWALRDAFPDVLRGLHIREEVRDYVDAEAEEISPQSRVTGAALIEQARGASSASDAETTSGGDGDAPDADTTVGASTTAGDTIAAETVTGGDSQSGDTLAAAAAEDAKTSAYDPKAYAIPIKRRTDKSLNYLAWRDAWADRLADVRSAEDIDRLVEVNRDGLDHCKDTAPNDRLAIDRRIDEARARIANEPPPAV